MANKQNLLEGWSPEGLIADIEEYNSRTKDEHEAFMKEFHRLREEYEKSRKDDIKNGICMMCREPVCSECSECKNGSCRQECCDCDESEECTMCCEPIYSGCKDEAYCQEHCTCEK